MEHRDYFNWPIFKTSIYTSPYEVCLFCTMLTHVLLLIPCDHFLQSCCQISHLPSCICPQSAIQLVPASVELNWRRWERSDGSHTFVGITLKPEPVHWYPCSPSKLDTICKMKKCALHSVIPLIRVSAAGQTFCRTAVNTSFFGREQQIMNL